MKRVVFFVHDDVKSMWEPLERIISIGVYIPDEDAILRKPIQKRSSKAGRNVEQLDKPLEYVPRDICVSKQWEPNEVKLREVCNQVAKDNKRSLLRVRSKDDVEKIMGVLGRPITKWEWGYLTAIGERAGRTFLIAIPLEVSDRSYNKWCRLVKQCKKCKEILRKNNEALDKDITATAERKLSKDPVLESLLSG